MARIVRSFQGTLDHDVTPNLQGGHRGSQVVFVLEISRRLREAGCRDERRFGRMVDDFFSNAKLVLESEKEKFESESRVGRIPRFTLCVKKFVRKEDDLEATAVELSIQEAPKPVPATKESIQALQKMRLEDASTEECMICIEITSMPCSHLFHGHCIEEWLNTSHQVPIVPLSNAN
ncbi:hypothetical protein CRYUN_Cryun09bG0142900 [Craigia yunnanensis]